jgi:hypothetical protein
MEQIKLYSKKTVFAKVFFVITILILIGSLISQDWNKPNWLQLFSAVGNVLVFFILTTQTYKKTRLELYKNHLIYRLTGQKQDSTIIINNQTKITNDWKGIYFNNDNSAEFITTNNMSKKEANKIFNKIEQFYKR